MTLSLDDVPPCPADPGELRRLAASIEAAGSATRLATDHALFTWGLLPGLYRAPEADDLQQRLRPLEPAAAEIDTGLRHARAAIETLADDLEAASRRRDALIADLHAHAATTSLHLPEPADPFTQRLSDIACDERKSAFRRERAALVEEWDAAARTCAAALRAIPDISWSLSRALSADEVVLASPSVSVLDEAAIPLLRRLSRREGADAARLLRENPEWAAIIRRGQPEAVTTWWAQLSPMTAAALVAGIPALIGNLDGVALADRVAANRARATGHLVELAAKRNRALGLHSSGTPRPRSVPSADLEGIDREIAYFQAVAAGRTQLYAWNPDHGSLIEMSGDPSTATSALFVVPGTNTTADSFYGDEPVTRFAEWQVRGGRGSVIAFTVLTGPMPQLDEIFSGGGPQWNHYAEERAPEYATFLRGVRATSPDLWTMSYEHSYGGGVGSAAEGFGGTVDARFLAASVGGIDGYTPSAGTAYFSAQGADDINRYYAGLQLGPLGFGTRPESIDGVKVVDSGLPGVDPLSVALGAPFVVGDSVDHHNRLMSDDERVNGTVLNTVNQILNEGRAAE